MSENVMIKSKGTLYDHGKKIAAGELNCQQTSATFTDKKGNAVLAFEFSHIRALKNVRNGGMASTITIKLADEKEYVFVLNAGVKVNNHIYAN